MWHRVLETEFFLCLPSLVAGNRLQAPRPFLNSKGQIQTVVNQAKEAMQRQGRSSQETIVQPWGRVLVPPQGITEHCLWAFLKNSEKSDWSCSLQLKMEKLDQIRSDQISRSFVSDSLRPHESQHARPPCPSPTPGVHSDSRPSSQRCHPAISSSVIPFSSCPQSLPASESFPMS